MFGTMPQCTLLTAISSSHVLSPSSCRMSEPVFPPRVTAVAATKWFVVLRRSGVLYNLRRLFPPLLPSFTVRRLTFRKWTTHRTSPNTISVLGCICAPPFTALLSLTASSLITLAVPASPLTRRTNRVRIIPQQFQLRPVHTNPILPLSLTNSPSSTKNS